MENLQTQAQTQTGGDLLECLLVMARWHDNEITREAAIAGLPLEQGQLTPGIFHRAATRAGLTTNHVRSKLSQLNSKLFPVILLLEPGCACVLRGINPSRQTVRVIFAELGQAEVEMPLAELESRYSGRAIYVRPRYQFDERGPEVSNLKQRHWFWSVILENRRLYRDVIVGSFIINVFALAMPLYIRNVYDRVVPNQAIATLWALTAGIAVVLLFGLILRIMRSVFVDLAASRADVKLSSVLMERVLGMRLESRPASAGSFASTLYSFESIRSFIGSATVTSLVDMPFAILFIVVIAMISPMLAVPIVVGIIVVLLYALATQNKLHEMSETVYRVGSQRNAILIESLVNLETVKSERAEGRIQAQWERSTAFLSRTGARMRVIGSSVGNVAQWAQQSVAAAVIVTGVYLIMSRELSLGGLIAAYLLSSRAMAPISRCAGLMTQFHHASVGLESLNEVMDKPVERPAGQRWVSRPSLEGDIELRGVSLRYPGDERDVIRDMSVRINAGEKVAILGRIGSGKSSLNKLLLGLYQPTAGAVMVDGADSRQIDPSDLRRNIGYVPQEVNLFYGSLRDNVVAGGGNEGVEDEALLRALKLAGLGELVSGHPHGVELQVGERGSMLSGGQRQSVGIARALVNDPPILLLDEPTSAMDHSSEQAFKRNLEEYAQGKTVVLVTHRTSLMSLVDRIMVMDSGRVVADGPKDEVIEALRKGQIGRAGS